MLIRLCDRVCSGAPERLLVRTLAGSAPAQGAANKMFSNKVPLCHGICNMTQWLSHCRWGVSVTHIAGKDHTWADAISRPRENAARLALLSADRQIRFILADLHFDHKAESFPAGSSIMTKWEASFAAPSGARNG